MTVGWLIMDAERARNRGANSALWRIALVRRHCHQPTKDYVARRAAEGGTNKEILRCLKRYIVREIYPRLPSPASLAGRQRCEDRPDAAI